MSAGEVAEPIHQMEWQQNNNQERLSNFLGHHNLFAFRYDKKLEVARIINCCHSPVVAS